MSVSPMWVPVITKVVDVLGSLFGKKDKQAGAEIQKMQAILEDLKKQNKSQAKLIDEYLNEAKQARKEIARLNKLIEKPIQDRKKKVDFVNGLKLEIKNTEKTLLIGSKGKGKSTFLWLQGKGPKPEKSMKDGTTKLVYGDDFIDTVGINWTVESLLKLFVIFIYRGIPSDVLVVHNDRIVGPIQKLAAVGVATPMAAIMRDMSLFYELVEDGAITIQEGKNGDIDIPERKLKFLYNLDAAKEISGLSLCKTVMHHNMDAAIEERSNAKVAPFAGLLTVLGQRFTAPSEADGLSPLKEHLFLLIHLFEKKYREKKDGELDCLNNATLIEAVEM
eukprot:CAMPEP_0185258086 /NCGR_PEP_ID=MMETSP1359-20130426/7063_1 /TAXON_ID=552665 /ORGANISM="Bigelowiella longifila, Strain CCMP242" /LENGTH=332 /DNA_ID=CAMNT_0027843441 /DNA_START=14 /DNA_END=1012 /DNA_ORIENTATION=-